MKLTLRNDEAPGKVKLALGGDILSGNAARVRNTLEQLIDDKKVKDIMIDFKAVNNVDAAGALCFLHAGELADDNNTELHLVNMKGHIFDFFKRNGLASVFKTTKVPVYSEEGDLVAE